MGGGGVSRGVVLCLILIRVKIETAVKQKVYVGRHKTKGCFIKSPTKDYLSMSTKGRHHYRLYEWVQLNYFLYKAQVL